MDVISSWCLAVNCFDGFALDHLQPNVVRYGAAVASWEKGHLVAKFGTERMAWKYTPNINKG